MARWNSVHDAVGMQEVVGSRDLWKALVAECLGTLLLTLIGCSSTIGWQADYQPSVVQIALSFGITVATIVQCICHVSGGHINPAVSVAMLAARQISLIRAVLYILVQCVGAIIGAALLKAVTPSQYQGSLGMTTVTAGLSGGQAFAVELLVTLVLVLVVFAVCDESRTDVRGSAPLAIGLAVTACHLGAIKFTGSSMNPARTFGPAVLTGIWNFHWVYWAGPLVGGVAASLIYTHAFRAQQMSSDSVELTEVKHHGQKQ